MEYKLTPIDFNPFEGDDADERVLTDAMVKGRKVYTCTHCKGPIAKGETHRSRRGVVDGELMSFRWCALCCEAMLKVIDGEDRDDDDFESDEEYEATVMAFERRTGLCAPTGDSSHG